jgi:hypothetical protein
VGTKTGLGALGLLLLLATAGDQPAGNEDAPKLYRFGLSPESAEQLAQQANAALQAGFPHGVSTRDETNRLDARWAYLSEVEGYFEVIQTGRNPHHFTVVLPNPVTPSVALVFNSLFRNTTAPVA